MVQAVLTFVLETCVVTTHMGRALGGFQDQVARWITGQILRRKPDGKWEYTLAATEKGGGVPDDGGINSAKAEHGCTVHHYMITARYV